jgi:hypothetical protein
MLSAFRGYHEPIRYSSSSEYPQISREIQFSHHNLIAAIIQMTFALHDRLNKPLVDGTKYDPLHLTGWYDQAEKRGLMPRSQLSFKDMFGDALPIDADPLGLRAKFRQEQVQRSFSFPAKPNGKSRERIESRPDGQQEFHIDYHPQWKPFGLLLSLVALHTVSYST